MVLNVSTLFQLHKYRGDQFYWWMEQGYPENTTELLRVGNNDSYLAIAMYVI
jgi:hypothetical protein